MTPHEKAINDAVAELGENDEFQHWQLDYGNLNHFVAKYLTTLLDSSEMKLSIHDRFWDKGYISSECVKIVETVIAAIKKEAGI